MVYFMILAANLIVLPIVAPLGFPVIVIGVVGFLSLLYCYTAVACSDPGIVYEEAEMVSHSTHTPPVVVGTATTLPGSGGGGVGGVGEERDIESLLHKEANTAEEAGTEDGMLVVQGTVVGTQSPGEESASATPTGASAGAAGASGTPQRSRQLAYSDRIECGQCELQRPYTARHCHYCGVCIDELDHHCPCKCLHISHIISFILLIVDIAFICL